MASIEIDKEQLLESLTVGITVLNKDFEIEYANATALKILGLSYEETVGKFLNDPQWKLVGRYGKELAFEQYPAVKALTTGKPVTNYEIGVFDNNRKEYNWLLCNAYLDYCRTSGCPHVVVTFTDVTQQKEHIPFKKIVENANDAVVVTEARKLRDGGPNIVYVNKAFTQLTGYMPEEVIGKTPRILQGKDTCEKTKARIYQHLCEHKDIREEILNYGKDGGAYWLDINIVPLINSQGDVTHFAAIERDMSVVKEHAASLERLSMTDPLTGLLNRRGFFSQANTSMEIAASQSKLSSVILLDIDHFKSVNDTHGHDVGDMVLLHLASLLREQLRETDIIGRMGGEEFAIVLSGIPRQILVNKVEAIRKVVADSACYVSDELSLTITISLGVSESTGTELSLDQLLKQADVALYQAKHNGRNRYVLAKKS